MPDLGPHAEDAFHTAGTYALEKCTMESKKQGHRGRMRGMTLRLAAREGVEEGVDTSPLEQVSGEG